eukprot:1335239-Amphidinium_carterae.1
MGLESDNAGLFLKLDGCFPPPISEERGQRDRGYVWSRGPPRPPTCSRDFESPRASLSQGKEGRVGKV